MERELARLTALKDISKTEEMRMNIQMKIDLLLKKQKENDND